MHLNICRLCQRLFFFFSLRVYLPFGRVGLSFFFFFFFSRLQQFFFEADGSGLFLLYGYISSRFVIN
jgi:hypothetical protein